MLTVTTGRGHTVTRPSKPAIGTRALSQEKVRRALLDWAADKPGWREDFMWNEWTPDATGRP
ncbi:hypothetical protein [Streptomyces sp. NPDC048242]|uniref:hypothetical protein n=1 Tax=Streptomyces sp. NPDC048242 TaxID=3155026 RepID=UPI0033D85BFF